MLAGWLVQDHLTQGHLTWCPRLRNSWERECLVAGAWRVSRTLGGGGRMSDGGELHEWAWVGAGCARPFSTCCVCAGSSVTACPGPSLGLAAQSCPSTRRADRSSNRAAWGRSSASSREEYPLPRRGPVSTCYAGYLLCWAVSARPDSPLSSCRAGPSAQGSLNAPDWLAGQHADRAWPTRRRGIRMPWWCWPAGRSPCCSPRQWPPGNESPCLILRQR